MNFNDFLGNQVKQGSVITFPNVRVPETGDYNMVLRYDTMRAGDWTDVRMTVQKGNGGAMGGDGCPNDDNRAAYRYPIINSVNKGKETCLVNSKYKQ